MVVVIARIALGRARVVGSRLVKISSERLAGPTPGKQDKEQWPVPICLARQSLSVLETTHSQLNLGTERGVNLDETNHACAC